MAARKKPAAKKKAPKAKVAPKAKKPTRAKAARKVYHVTPGKKGGWEVKAKGAKAPSARFDKKPEAVARAKALAQRGKLGLVVVYKMDGKIQSEYTYGGVRKRC